jgi:hypothetical protein
MCSASDEGHLPQLNSDAIVFILITFPRHPRRLQDVTVTTRRCSSSQHRQERNFFLGNAQCLVTSFARTGEPASKLDG